MPGVRCWCGFERCSPTSTDVARARCRAGQTFQARGDSIATSVAAGTALMAVTAQSDTCTGLLKYIYQVYVSCTWYNTPQMQAVLHNLPVVPRNLGCFGKTCFHVQQKHRTASLGEDWVPKTTPCCTVRALLTPVERYSSNA